MSILGIIIVIVIIVVIVAVGFLIFRSMSMKNANTLVTPGKVVSPSVPTNVPQRQQPSSSTATTNSSNMVPYKVVGGNSWFQVLDRNGGIIATHGVPSGNPTFTGNCGDGEVSFVGVRDNGQGETVSSILCETSAGTTVVGNNTNIDRYYSLFPASCPEGYLREDLDQNESIPFSCAFETQCQYNRDCPAGSICSNGRCETIENF